MDRAGQRERVCVAWLFSYKLSQDTVQMQFHGVILSFCMHTNMYSRPLMDRTILNRENMFETGVFGANECLSWRQIRRNDRDIFSIFFDMKVCCGFSLVLPHRGDSNECTQYTNFNI